MLYEVIITNIMEQTSRNCISSSIIQVLLIKCMRVNYLLCSKINQLAYNYSSAIVNRLFSKFSTSILILSSLKHR